MSAILEYRYDGFGGSSVDLIPVAGGKRATISVVDDDDKQVTERSVEPHADGYTDIFIPDEKVLRETARAELAKLNNVTTEQIQFVSTGSLADQFRELLAD